MYRESWFVTGLAGGWSTHVRSNVSRIEFACIMQRRMRGVTFWKDTPICPRDWTTWATRRWPKSSLSGSPSSLCISSVYTRKWGIICGRVCVSWIGIPRDRTSKNPPMLNHFLHQLNTQTTYNLLCALPEADVEVHGLHRWSFFSRNIAKVTPKIIYFYYL